MSKNKIKNPLISVVIPVFKAQNSLIELYNRLTRSLGQITGNYEILFIEDCGGDSSWDIIESLSKKDKRIIGIQFTRNFGQHKAITAGIDNSKGDWIVVMDCDLQDRPEEIIKLYSKTQEGYDVVLAIRTNRQDSLLKKFFSWFFYKIFNYFTEMNYDGRVGNFRIISRQVAQNLMSMKENLRFFGGMVDWLGFPAASIDIIHNERYEGKSTYTFYKLFKLATDVIIAYSDKPLRLSIKLGFSMSIFTFFFGLYIIIRSYIYSIPVMGWSSLIVSVFFLGGIIIANLGIIGIYLGKTFDEVKKRPIYIVRRKSTDL